MNVTFPLKEQFPIFPFFIFRNFDATISPELAKERKKHRFSHNCQWRLFETTNKIYIYICLYIEEWRIGKSTPLCLFLPLIVACFFVTYIVAQGSAKTIQTVQSTYSFFIYFIQYNHTLYTLKILFKEKNKIPYLLWGKKYIYHIIQK